jgi:hypothetical protein
LRNNVLITSSQLLTLYGKVKNVAKREGGTACKGRGQIRPTACPGGGVLNQGVKHFEK